MYKIDRRGGVQNRSIGQTPLNRPGLYMDLIYNTWIQLIMWPERPAALLGPLDCPNRSARPKNFPNATIDQ